MLTIVVWRERSRPLARVTFGDPDDELGRAEVPCENRDDVVAAVWSWLDRIDWGAASRGDTSTGEREP